MPSSPSKLAILLGVVAIMFSVTAAASAQQGHSPFAATPVAESVSGWEVAEVVPVALDGSPITLSPDGSFIAGIGVDAGFCIWSVPDLDPT